MRKANRLRLRLPLLSAPEERAGSSDLAAAGGEGARERAERLVEFAWQAEGRSRVRAARKALALWPDCVDAHLILGNSAPDAASACEHYARAVAAGERELGADLFRQRAGSFWAIHETRPYMEARCLLAEGLGAAGRRKEAREHCEELLRLNPTDNQGVRYFLAETLLELGRDDRVEELLAAYEEDRLAAFSYVRTLLAYRRQGDSTETLRLLRDALRANRFVPAYLLGKRPLPAEPPALFSPGREDEAVEYACRGAFTWEATPGALEWLERRTSKRAPKARRRSGDAERKGSRPS